jgi:hypothetical protein
MNALERVNLFVSADVGFAAAPLDVEGDADDDQGEKRGGGKEAGDGDAALLHGPVRVLLQDNRGPRPYKEETREQERHAPCRDDGPVAVWVDHGLERRLELVPHIGCDLLPPALQWGRP